ncbi:hypothetical protein pb186bvf_012933 [Paramecium bursaria]
MQKVDYIFKIALIGSQNVGKSSIMTRFVDSQFNDSYLSTIGVDFKIKTIQVGDKVIKIQIWDTAGQERFQALTQTHYKGAHGCISVFDTTSKKSLDDAKRFLKLVIDEHGLIQESCYLVANKIDLDNRLVTTQDGQAAAQELGVNYIETSAKFGQNIANLFQDLAKIILNLVDQKRTVPVIPEQETTRLRQLQTEPVDNCAC